MKTIKHISTSSLLLISLMFLFIDKSYAQLKVRKETNFSKMVRQSFVGPGVTISNVLFRGDTAAIGVFDGRNSNIGLDSGIIITTGRAVDAIGPDNSIASTSQDGGRTDGDLNSLLPSGLTKDASYIQFTFTPSSSVATFKFVFASEEYQDYVGYPFNDIFGFFLSGPGIVGKKNIAIVPGTQDPISINTINPNVNSNLFVNNIGGATIQYNGFTKVIEIVADNLIPCENYVLKMAIADVVDAIYDSGIFLSSMDSKAPNNAYVNNIIPQPGTDAIQEKCDSIVFRFSRSGTDLTSNQLVKYLVSGTATRGLDYTNIPDSVFIPSGKAFVDLKIFPVDDNVVENNETIIISITNNTVCAISIDSLEIKDYDTLKITTFKDVFCKGDTIYKQVLYGGGSSHLSFVWTDSLGVIKGVTPVLEASPDSVTMYIITITDSCLNNYQVIDTIYIPPIQIITMVIPNDTVVCAPLDLNLFVLANRTGLNYKWTALDPSQNPVGTFNNDTLPNPIYSVPDGVFTIVVTCTVDSPNFCANNPSFTIRTIPKGIYGPTNVYVCIGDSTTLRAYGGGTYKWSPSDGIVGDTTSNTVRVFKPGLYTANITDTVNCSRDYTVNVVYDTIPIANAGRDYVICERSSIQLNAMGSQYGTYEWSPATGLTNSKIANPIASPLVTTTYVLKAKNNACFSFDTMTIRVIVKPENDFTYNLDSCAKVISFSNNTAGTDSFYWDFGDNTYSFERNPIHKYDSAGPVTISLYTNRNTDCMDTMSVDINLVDIDFRQRKIPNTFTPNGDNINDVFRISGGNVGCVITKMSIYNRWGKLLHEIKDKEVWEWDGRIGGEIAPQGVYFYSIVGEGFEDVGLVNVVY